MQRAWVSACGGPRASRGRAGDGNIAPTLQTASRASSASVPSLRSAGGRLPLPAGQAQRPQHTRSALRPARQA